MTPQSGLAAAVEAKPQGAITATAVATSAIALMRTRRFTACCLPSARLGNPAIASGPARKHVHPGATVQPVPTAPSIQTVRSPPTEDPVRSRPTEHDVMPAKRADDVVALQAADDVGARRSAQVVDGGRSPERARAVRAAAAARVDRGVGDLRAASVRHGGVNTASELAVGELRRERVPGADHAVATIRVVRGHLVPVDERVDDEPLDV